MYTMKLKSWRLGPWHVMSFISKRKMHFHAQVMIKQFHLCKKTYQIRLVELEAPKVKTFGRLPKLMKVFCIQIIWLPT